MAIKSSNILIKDQTSGLYLRPEETEFYATQDKWRLSPAFDINPSLEKSIHALSIDGKSNEPDVGFALEIASYFSPENEKKAEKWVLSTRELIENELVRVAKYNRINPSEANHFLSRIKDNKTYKLPTLNSKEKGLGIE